MAAHETDLGSNEWRALRRRMVRRDIAARGISDRRVLAAMAWAPREQFVPESHRVRAYADLPLPIGNGQTISQPYIVALMTQAAHVTRCSRVLEIGTGSGYQTAILAKIGRHVFSVDRIASLADDAARRTRALGLANVSYVHGDGSLGWSAAAPYDVILVAAAAPRIPDRLVDQLAVGGHLVIPIGDRDTQELTIARRTETAVEQYQLGSCRFVPLVSPHAFTE